MAESDPAKVNIQVSGNVEGSIIVGSDNFVVNNNYGTIINQQAPPQVRPRNVATQPPRAPRGFLNRSTELQLLDSWISTNQVILVHGPDGMGKSALIRQAVNGSAGRSMPHGVLLVEDAGANHDILGPADIIQRLFDALFESVPSLKVNAETARAYLSNTRPLLVVDEVSLSPALQNSLPDLFPNGAMIFTSQLRVGNGDLIQLPVEPLPREVTLRLFADRSGVEVNDQNQATIASLCALLEDIPLAVVITANVIRELKKTPEEALQSFQKASDSFRTGLDLAYRFAFSLLTPSEQHTISIAAFTPGLTMSPEWLAAGSGSQSPERDTERLKALGLLAASGQRLLLPSGIRIPARRASTLDESRVLRQLTAFLLATVQASPHDWGFFSNELGNMHGVLTWAARTRNWRLVLEVGRKLDPYLTLNGLWDTWQDVLEFVLEAARQSGNRAAEAFALHQIGVRQIGVGSRQKALEFFYQALRIRQVLGDGTGMAYTQHNIDFLLGPPPPPGTGQPGPPIPKTGLIMEAVPWAAGTFGLLTMMGVILLWIISRWPFTPLPLPTPTAPVAQAFTATSWFTDTPSFTPVITATDTLTPSPTLSPVVPFLSLRMATSPLDNAAFLYKGRDEDYFEVPFVINLSNSGPADIDAFNLFFTYQVNGENHGTQFRFADQTTYSTSHMLGGLVMGQFINQEVRVKIPRRYQNTEVVLIPQVDLCRANTIQCTQNSLTYSLPLIVYDFIEKAPNMPWQANGSNLTFGGPINDQGSVGIAPGLLLENGVRPDLALYTRPARQNNKYISGNFIVDRNIQFAPGDLLFVGVGFLDGAQGSDGVTFRIYCANYPAISLFQTISLHEQPGYIYLVTLPDQYDGVLRDKIVSLNSTASSCNNFTLEVSGGSTADSDLAVWLSAYIARYRSDRFPPPPPTSTPQPPSATPASGPVRPPVNRTLLPPIIPTPTDGIIY